MSVILIGPAQAEQFPHNDIVVGSTFGASSDVFPVRTGCPPADQDFIIFVNSEGNYISDVISINNPTSPEVTGFCRDGFVASLSNFLNESPSDCRPRVRYAVRYIADSESVE